MMSLTSRATAKSRQTQKNRIGVCARIPKDYWSGALATADSKDFAVEGEQAFDGHPGGPSLCGQHFDNQLTQVGFLLVTKQKSPSVYYPKLKLVLMAYVDEFELARP
jgi:hypothetical protein